MINIRKTLATAGYGAERLPDITLDPTKIYAVMINEVVPADPRDDFYAAGDPSEYLTSALALFRAAGGNVADADEITARGVYMTNAAKIPKTGYEVEKSVIEQCVPLLEAEISLFPNLKVIMLMGDVAKKAFNIITRKTTGKPVIPAVPTYKLRGGEFFYKDIRVLPSYIMTGQNLRIEKQKLQMTTEDVMKMMELIRR